MCGTRECTAVTGTEGLGLIVLRKSNHRCVCLKIQPAEDDTAPEKLWPLRGRFNSVSATNIKSFTTEKATVN